MFSLSVFLLVLIVKATIAQSDEQFSEAPEVATAFINLKGVIGYIRFETINDTAVSVETNFTGLPGLAHNWHIHRFPIDLTLSPDTRCLNNYAGGHYDPLMTRSNPDYSTDCSSINMTACEVGDLTGKFGQLANGLSDNIDDTGLLELGGIRGIVGRSIVVHATNGANFVCGTIRSNIEQETNTKIVTLSATFIAPLAGVIYLRQAGYEHAVMFGKLFWVNQMGTTDNHNWHIHQDMPTTNYRTGECMVGPHYDPFNRPPPSDPQYFCTPEPSNITNCEVGDLTGKHDTVDISANPLPYQEQAFFYTDIFLNLTGTNAVINRSIAIHDGAPIIACAPLVLTEARIANSFINGEFSARQDSPYEETIISSTNGIPSNPILLPDVLSTYDLCPLNRTPYNPLGITATELTTPDQIAIGNIYRKHANLLNRALFSITEFPLFGTNIITSRTLMSSSNDRRSCSAIPPPINQGSTIIAVASFSTTIQGTILFIQEQLSDGTLGQTNVIVDIHYVAATTMQSTSGHNWHIHTLPPTLNQACQGNIGPHFNPFNVSLDSDNLISNYSSDCSPFSKLRCESGDLTGKHGPLTIDRPGENMATYSYLDPNLNLYGPEEHTIIGRSVGIHQNIVDGPILYCAEVRLANISTVQLAMTEPSNYNRVDFVNNVARSSGISAESILVNHVGVNGSPPSPVRNITCVNMTLSVLEFSDLAGSIVQGSLCDLYRSDQCMTTADYYAIQCPSGARSTTTILSFFIILLLVAIAAQ